MVLGTHMIKCYTTLVFSVNNETFFAIQALMVQPHFTECQNIQSAIVLTAIHLNSKVTKMEFLLVEDESVGNTYKSLRAIQGNYRSYCQ